VGLGLGGSGQSAVGHRRGLDTFALRFYRLLVRALRLSFDSVDRGLEEAARTLGAGPSSSV